MLGFSYFYTDGFDWLNLINFFTKKDDGMIVIVVRRKSMKQKIVQWN